MYDELVKRLRELQAITERCDEQSCAECENRELCNKHDNKTLSGTYKDAADAIEELSKPRWIPVTERLPDGINDVLVYAGVLFSYITVGYYDGLWKFSFNDSEIAWGADYWMPLPEPPEEEA